MTYTPSKREVLEGHYRPPGAPCFHEGVCEELEAEGFLLELPKDNTWLPGARGWMLSTKGREILEMFRGERTSLPFKLPNWVLMAATE